MKLIKTAIERPIAVIAAVLLVVLFGLVALKTIPIQLAPDVNRPVITVSTNWFGAAPAEVEREIINLQEEQLAGLEGLTSITGRSEQGRGRITLEFKIGTNMDKALLLVANRLDRVSDYPGEADQPTLDTAGSEDNAIAWMMIKKLPGNNRPIHEYGDFVKDIVKDRLERVPGIGRINVYGGSEREIHVVVSPELLAQYGLTVGDLVKAMRNANISLGAGDVNEGKRRYIVRTEGELNNLDIIRQVPIRSNDSNGALGRVVVADVAEISFGYKEPSSSIRMLGQASLAMSAERQTGANVIETMNGLREAIAELNRNTIPGAGLSLEQVYDETVYINSAIDLVQQNIWVGGSLAALILLLFLRSFRATVIISPAIPVSVIGAFVAMAALGRSINVISLAGLAFAVGMVVDAAIVVLENIYRHKEAGYSNIKAAYLGAQQVWGAVLVSALTTVMVFIPILVMELEAGQLFRDIAVAISVSVVLSLVVSITVIPALSRRLLGENKTTSGFRLPIIDPLGSFFVRLVMRFTDGVVKHRFRAFLVTAFVTGIACYGSYLMLPKLEYLPEGNRNLLFGIIIPPPGYNLDTTTQIAQGIENETRHLWANETGAESADGEPPKIERFFYVATRARTFLGAISVEPQRIGELKPVLRKPVFREPGTFGFITQPSVFGRGIGGGRKIDLDISGSSLDSILQVSNRAFGKIVGLFPRSEGHEWRPRPGLEMGAPEIRVTPDRSRLSDSGISTVDLAQTIDAFNDGLRATQSTIDGKLMDIIIKGEANVAQTQDIGTLPLVTPGGQIIPVSSVAQIDLTAGPTEILHRERFRTITLEVRPNQAIALESAIELLQTEVIDKLQAEGLPDGIKMRISGTADKLVETRNAMAINLTLSIIIVFLVMAVLFESFIYPLIIMLSVPIAAVGGIAGLAVLNRYSYQPLDMLTMLGFVILIGIVVNNAILLVHQTLHHIREEKLDAKKAIRQATQNRIRPIFMSTLTSIFGMLPLVLFPGAGSELYRGLGSVVVGGLSLSAIITLLIVPPMMSLLVVPLEKDGATSWLELRPSPFDRGLQVHRAFTVIKNRYLLGVIVVLLGGVFLSSSGIFLRHIESAGGWSILFYRSCAFFITMSTILAFQYRGKTISAFRAIGNKGFYAAILLSFGNVFYIFALLNTTVANVVFIIGSAPLITALLGWLFLRERISGWGMVSMLVAFLGIGLMLVDGLSSGGLFGSMLALAMVVMYAVYLLLLRDSQSVDMVPATCLSGLITATIALPMLADFTISQHDLIICLLLGTVQFGAGFWLLTIGVRYIPAAEVALFSLSESILNPIWVWLGVGEVPGALTLWGSAIVLAAVIGYSVLAIMREKQTLAPLR